MSSSYLWPLVEAVVPSVHRAVVEVSMEQLFALLLPPEGMTVVSTHVDPQRRTVSFVVEHPGLKAVESGWPLPNLDPTYTSIGGPERISADWGELSG